MLKDLVYGTAMRMGFNLQPAIPADRVRDLFALLHPVETGIPLIRIGGPADGGYLVPDDLDGIVACFSPGVDVTATFEAEMLARGIPCYLADASVEAPPIADPGIDFEKKFLGVINDDITTTLDGWVARKNRLAAGDLLLQMDIEGHELAVLTNVSEELLRRFRIIVIEFHGLPRAFDPVALRSFRACFERLARDFHVVHAHPNNVMPARRLAGMEIPPFLEVTYLRKDRAEPRGYVRGFPHPLDAANVRGPADYVLPRSFRGGERP